MTNKYLPIVLLLTLVSSSWTYGVNQAPNENITKNKIHISLSTYDLAVTGLKLGLAFFPALLLVEIVDVYDSSKKVNLTAYIKKQQEKEGVILNFDKKVQFEKEYANCIAEANHSMKIDNPATWYRAYKAKKNCNAFAWRMVMTDADKKLSELVK